MACFKDLELKLHATFGFRTIRDQWVPELNPDIILDTIQTFEDTRQVYVRKLCSHGCVSFQTPKSIHDNNCRSAQFTLLDCSMHGVYNGESQIISPILKAAYTVCWQLVEDGVLKPEDCVLDCEAMPSLQSIINIWLRPFKLFIQVERNMDGKLASRLHLEALRYGFSVLWLHPEDVHGLESTILSAIEWCTERKQDTFVQFSSSFYRKNVHTF